MAKKQQIKQIKQINQSAEIRSIAEQLGKDAKFKDVFAKLQAQFPGHRFNENSCQQAFTLARQKLGFAPGPRRDKKTPAKPKVALAARVVPARSTSSSRADNGLVVDAITTAQKLIDVCGGREAAKHTIDNVTT
jgi:hypothetical protein